MYGRNQLLPKAKPSARPTKMRRLYFCTLLAALNIFSGPVFANDDLINMSLEKLLEVEVYGASKYAQKTSEAPASVKSRVTVVISEVSPATVPVPCASNRPTVAGEYPAIS